MPIKIDATNRLRYAYDSAGRAVTLTDYDNRTLVYGYDANGRATTVDSFTYGLTAGSQITKITHNDGSYWDYGNDAGGRLTTAVRKDSGNNTQTSHAYVYDAGDNMLSKTVDGTLTTFAYTNGKELTTQTVGGTTTSMYYDVAGRMISKAQGAYTATYDWRYDAKLYAVTSNFPNEGTVNYEYRGDGKRYTRTAGGTTTRYNWDRAWNEVSEGDGSNNLLTTFTLDNPAAQVARMLAEIAGSTPSTGTAKYYFKDHLGSTRRVHAADKSTLATTEFQPYGDTYATTGTQPAFSFTGKPWDATAAMYYFPYRYYSPGMSRWISRDPEGDVDGPNVYGYVKHAPVSSDDLLGLWGADVHGRYAYFDEIRNPMNPFFMYMHFQGAKKNTRMVDEAISKCDARNFGNHMHRLQDAFSHYNEGYRWWTLGHVFNSIMADYLGLSGIVHDPDDADSNADARAMTNAVTEMFEGLWRSNCGSVPTYVVRRYPAALVFRIGVEFEYTTNSGMIRFGLFG